MLLNKKQIKSNIYNIYRSIFFVIESNKKLCITRSVLLIMQSILPLASLYFLKVLIDSITSANSSQVEGVGFIDIAIYASYFSAVFLLIRVADIIIVYTDDILTENLVDYITGLLHKKSTELDLSYYDKAQYHDTFHRAQEEADYRPVQVLNNLTGIIRDSLTLVGIVALLVTLSFWVVVIMVSAALPALLVKLWKSKILYNWRKENTPLIRKTHYLSKLLTGRGYAKELRIFNLADHFQKQYAAIRKGLVAQVVQLIKGLAKFDLLSSAFEVGALLASILLISNKTFSGAITIGGFVMFFEAFRRGQGIMRNIVSNISGLYSNMLFLDNLFEFFELHPAIKTPCEPVPFPAKIQEGIVFKNVSFSYPESAKLVLDNFSFHAKPGEVTLIRGNNGAGKTTLIKLLCRLYDCTSGAIYIDGVNIKDFDLQELRKNISLTFQDFVQYDFTVEENIALGDIECEDCSDKIRKAAKLSSADEFIQDLPRRYDTLLGKYFEKGEELSMGQWQRIALARALNKNSKICILDEPTSWMDIDAQASFNNQLDELKQNRVFILVNHSENNIVANEVRII
ncbi:MAG: ABC transporter ATP-binding protein [Candidatus Electrothrix communis]|nr:MAG: ABC transporter ATP-binding protein [Candidatus Electrothrix communis]